MKEGLEVVQNVKEKLCEALLKEAREDKTPAWTMDELEVVLEHLKKDTSRDLNGYANELFKAAGSDLKEAILILMNAIKDEQVIPQEFKLCNISSIWREKIFLA